MQRAASRTIVHKVSPVATLYMSLMKLARDFDRDPKQSALVQRRCVEFMPKGNPVPSPLTDADAASGDSQPAVSNATTSSSSSNGTSLFPSDGTPLMQLVRWSFRNTAPEDSGPAIVKGFQCLKTFSEEAPEIELLSRWAPGLSLLEGACLMRFSLHPDAAKGRRASRDALLDSIRAKCQETINEIVRRVKDECEGQPTSDFGSASETLAVVQAISDVIFVKMGIQLVFRDTFIPKESVGGIDASLKLDELLVQRSCNSVLMGIVYHEVASQFGIDIRCINAPDRPLLRVKGPHLEEGHGALGPQFVDLRQKGSIVDLNLVTSNNEEKGALNTSLQSLPVRMHHMRLLTVAFQTASDLSSANTRLLKSQLLYVVQSQM